MAHSRDGFALAEGQPDDCIACRERLCTLFPRSDRTKRQTFRRVAKRDRLEVGDTGQIRFWIIIDGVAATCNVLADGRRQIVSFEFTGDIVCGSAACMGSGSHVEALTDCSICEVTFPAEADGLLNDPDVAPLIFQRVHRRVEQGALHAIALGRFDSMERICLFMAEMARRIGTSDGNAIRVGLCMSRDDIADYLGLNPETVSRTMSRIKRRGLAVFTSPSTFVVPDLDALESRIPVEIGLHSPGRAQVRNATAEAMVGSQ